MGGGVLFMYKDLTFNNIVELDRCTLLKSGFPYVAEILNQYSIDRFYYRCLGLPYGANIDLSYGMILNVIPDNGKYYNLIDEFEKSDTYIAVFSLGSSLVKITVLTKRCKAEVKQILIMDYKDVVTQLGIYLLNNSY